MGLVKKLALRFIDQWLLKVTVLFVKLKGLDKKVIFWLSINNFLIRHGLGDKLNMAWKDQIVLTGLIFILFCYPLVNEVSKEGANLSLRKKHPPLCQKFVCMSVMKFDLCYLRTGWTEWAQKLFGASIVGCRGVALLGVLVPVLW